MFPAAPSRWLEHERRLSRKDPPVVRHELRAGRALMGPYAATVPLMLFGWIPIAVVAGRRLGPLRGVVFAFVGGWLFLPVAGYKFEGLPAYTRDTAIALSALAVALSFDSARLSSFRFKAYDLPMLVWCASPAVSSLVNGLGPVDALYATIDQMMTWGIPYYLGRVYLTSPQAVRVFAMGIVVGGLVYAPLCLYEIRMSPQLHTMVYGFHQHQFMQAKRFGGWRPTVFLPHGLAVGLYMCSSAVACIWLWRRRAEERVLGMKIAWVAVLLTVVAVMCKSVGAIALLVIALAALMASRAFRIRAPLIALVLAAPLYMGLRTSGIWSGESLVEMSGEFEEGRAESLQSRLNSENAIVAHAMQQPVFGWAGWGRNMVDETGHDLAIMDGYWTIVISKWGLVGLAAMTAALLLPVLRLLLETPGAELASSSAAPAIAVGIVLTMSVIDSLFNAMPNPMYAVAAGGLLEVASSYGAVATKVPRGRRTAASARDAARGRR